MMSLDFQNVVYLVPAALLCAMGILGRRSRANRREGTIWLVLGSCVLALMIVRVMRLQNSLSDWGREKAIENDVYARRRDMQVAMILASGAIAAVGFELSRRGAAHVSRTLSACIALILWLAFLTAVRTTSYHYSDELFGRRILGPMSLGGLLDAIGLVPLIVLVGWRIKVEQKRTRQMSRRRSSDVRTA